MFDTVYEEAKLAMTSYFGIWEVMIEGMDRETKEWERVVGPAVNHRAPGSRSKTQMRSD